MQKVTIDFIGPDGLTTDDIADIVKRFVNAYEHVVMDRSGNEYTLTNLYGVTGASDNPTYLLSATKGDSNES